jgi:hypothetical protein
MSSRKHGENVTHINKTRQSLQNQPTNEFSMSPTVAGSHFALPSVADESIPAKLLRLAICIILTNVNLISGYYQAQKHLLYRPAYARIVHVECSATDPCSKQSYFLILRFSWLSSQLEHKAKPRFSLSCCEVE